MPRRLPRIPNGTSIALTYYFGRFPCLTTSARHRRQIKTPNAGFIYHSGAWFSPWFSPSNQRRRRLPRAVHESARAHRSRREGRRGKPPVAAPERTAWAPPTRHDPTAGGCVVVWCSYLARRRQGWTRSQGPTVKAPCEPQQAARSSRQARVAIVFLHVDVVAVARSEGLCVRRERGGAGASASNGHENDDPSATMDPSRARQHREKAVDSCRPPGDPSSGRLRGPLRGRVARDRRRPRRSTAGKLFATEPAQRSTRTVSPR